MHQSFISLQLFLPFFFFLEFTAPFQKFFFLFFLFHDRNGRTIACRGFPRAMMGLRCCVSPLGRFGCLTFSLLTSKLGLPVWSLLGWFSVKCHTHSMITRSWLPLRNRQTLENPLQPLPFLSGTEPWQLTENRAPYRNTNRVSFIMFSWYFSCLHNREKRRKLSLIHIGQLRSSSSSSSTFWVLLC